MRILILASGNSSFLSPFVKEQAESLIKKGILIDFFLIKGKGILGYLKNYFLLLKKIKQKEYDLIHAHYGLSGLLAVMQISIPVIITFHGSDINMKKNYILSRLASNLSANNIFVHENLPSKLKIYKRSQNIIPCGFDKNIFFHIPQKKAKKILGWNKDTRHIVFSSAFDNKIKNAPLAKLVTSEIPNCQLVELKGYGKEQINLILNASDLLLVTSFSETGPIIVKEALACDCPIVSTDVGDVSKIIRNVPNTYISSYEPKEIRTKIDLILSNPTKINGREAVNKFELDIIASKVKSVYSDTLKNIKNESFI